MNKLDDKIVANMILHMAIIQRDILWNLNQQKELYKDKIDFSKTYIDYLLSDVFNEINQNSFFNNETANDLTNYNYLLGKRVWIKDMFGDKKEDIIKRIYMEYGFDVIKCELSSGTTIDFDEIGNTVLLEGDREDES